MKRGYKRKTYKRKTYKRKTYKRKTYKRKTYKKSNVKEINKKRKSKKRKSKKRKLIGGSNEKEAIGDSGINQYQGPKEMFPDISVKHPYMASMADAYKKELKKREGGVLETHELDPDSPDWPNVRSQQKLLQGELWDISQKVGILEAMSKDIGLAEYLQGFTGIGTSSEQEEKLKQMWSSVKREVEEKVAKKRLFEGRARDLFEGRARDLCSGAIAREKYENEDTCIDDIKQKLELIAKAKEEAIFQALLKADASVEGEDRIELIMKAMDEQGIQINEEEDKDIIEAMVDRILKTEEEAVVAAAEEKAKEEAAAATEKEIQIKRIMKAMVKQGIQINEEEVRDIIDMMGGHLHLRDKEFIEFIENWLQH